ncbi:MAG: endonuclease III [Anaerolineales bacterium]|nr:endonuclease III [Anaerolineales bacterium]MCS7248273.1 endonuclease III [Anaerolineales bacterium]MDW8162087.1 endonuclease III [Anaerolineales bacterium]MDW8448197.1 endonuclease III [Anaerolineales bacterium]
MDPKSSEKKPLAQQITQKLHQLYGEPQWRRPLSPLDELISTILSQNTNDGNRDRAFEALRQRFPTWEAVRDAPLEAVVEAIRPAGLAEQKGPRIQAILRAITAQRGRLDLDFLREFEPEAALRWLQQFKGVGPKTAAIVVLFSLNKPAFPVDTHIHRVTRRLGLIPHSTSAEQAHRLLAELFDKRDYASVHLNLIRLGREICRARKPKCPICPLKEDCAFYRREDRS